MFLPGSLRTVLSVIVKHSSNPNLCFNSSFAIMTFNLSQHIFIASNWEALLTCKRAQENLSRALFWLLKTSSSPQCLTVCVWSVCCGFFLNDISAKKILCIFPNVKRSTLSKTCTPWSLTTFLRIPWIRAAAHSVRTAAHSARPSAGCHQLISWSDKHWVEMWTQIQSKQVKFTISNHSLLQQLLYTSAVTWRDGKWNTGIHNLKGGCMATLLYFWSNKKWHFFSSMGILFFIYVCLQWIHISDIQIVISHKQIYSTS